MPTPKELEAKFWSALKSDMTVMLGIQGQFPRPMTAQREGDAGPIWFFTARDTELVRALPGASPAIMTFTSKGHDLFASVSGAASSFTSQPARC